MPPSAPAKALEAPAAVSSPALSREALEARDKAKALAQACREAREESDKALAFYKRQAAKRAGLEAEADKALAALEEAFFSGKAPPQEALGSLLSAYKEACPKGRLVR